MSDRTSAGIFSSIFEILLDHHNRADRKAARLVSDIARQAAALTKGYDFSPWDMENENFGPCELQEELGVDFGIDCTEEDR